VAYNYSRLVLSGTDNRKRHFTEKHLMRGTKKLGDVLREAGLIDEFQLDSALSHQRNWGGKLGSILVEKGFIGEEDLARAMSEKLHIPHVDLFDPEIPEEVINLIKPDVAKKYSVVPVRKEAHSLMLALSNPLDIEAIDTIRFITGINVKPCFALESEITDALRKYYDHENVDRRRKSPAAREEAQETGIIHGANAGLVAAPSPEEGTQRLDALVSLLVEKGVITREELAAMIRRVKTGR
jgi:MshEN domain